MKKAIYGLAQTPIGKEFFSVTVQGQTCKNTSQVCDMKDDGFVLVKKEILHWQSNGFDLLHQLCNVNMQHINRHSPLYMATMFCIVQQCLSCTNTEYSVHSVASQLIS